MGESKRRKSQVPDGHHVSDWSVYAVGEASADLVSTLMAEHWGRIWLRDVLLGNRDCTCCGSLVGVPNTGAIPPAIVAVSILPVGADSAPSWVVVTMCLACAEQHPSLVLAGETLCQDALKLLGSTETSVLSNFQTAPDALQ